MEYLVNSSEMKKYDSTTIHHYGMPGVVLMERAALSVVESLNRERYCLDYPLIICGTGNNGGDGLAIARLLHLAGHKVEVCLIGDTDKCTPETREQLNIVQNYGISIRNQVKLSEYTILIDALFGIGLSRTIEGIYKSVIEQINESGVQVVSVDIPSGISADTGKIMGIAVKADMTVTFAYKKIGSVLYPGAFYSGKIIVCDIGITDTGFMGENPKVYSYTKEDLRLIPKRLEYSNKGTYGKVLVIAGSVNMSGAAYFSAKASYRMGTGLVKILTPKANRSILQSMIPEALLAVYEEDYSEDSPVQEAITWADVIVIGPGMGIGKTSLQILQFVINNADVPLIVDADAINIAAKNPQILENHKQPIIITPHLGEMSRLCNTSISDIADSLIQTASACARKYGVICVLKDTRTIVADPDECIYINQSGNNAMATGGSGDVLTGIIAGLLAGKCSLYESAALGVYIHGLAGEFAANRLGSHSVMASDIIDSISLVIQSQ